MRVLVCGGRNYQNGQHLSAVLNKLHAEAGIDVLIEGGAKGADYLAHVWAAMNDVEIERYEADWENQGTFAGPARNKRMLDEGKPDVVIAFPGGRGTADMIRKARRAGVEVVEISHA